MKLLSILFGIYILILPCLPCTDTDGCEDASQNSITQISNHQDKEDCPEACNPYCNCFCCGHIASPNFQQIKIETTRPLLKERLQCFYDNVSLSSDFFGNIWQPPKSC